jgi:hypothetical protein
MKYVASNGSSIDEWWLKKKVDEIIRGLVDVLYQKFPVGIYEGPERAQSIQPVSLLRIKFTAFLMQFLSVAATLIYLFINFLWPFCNFRCCFLFPVVREELVSTWSCNVEATQAIINQAMQ